MNFRDSLKKVQQNELEMISDAAESINKIVVNEDDTVKEFKQIINSGAVDELKSLTIALNELKDFIASSENLEVIEIGHIIKNLSEAVTWLGDKYSDFEEKVTAYDKIPDIIENLRIKIKEEDTNLSEVLKSDFKKQLSHLTAKINKNYMGGSGGGEVNLRRLDDVDISALADGRFLKYDGAQGKFVFASPAAAAGNIDLANLDQDMLPDQDDLRSIGSATKKFKDLYLSGNTLHLGAIQIKSTGDNVEFIKTSDGLPATVAGFSNDWADITNKPTTLSGFGITDAFDGDYDSLANKPTVPTNIQDLSNVTSGTNPATGSVLTWTANNAWQPQSVFSGNYDNLYNKPTLFDGDYFSLTNLPVIPDELNDLNNVSTGTPNSGEVLTWNGSNWASAPVTSSGTPSLASLSDTNIQGTPNNGEVLTWNGTWQALDIPQGFDGDYNSLTNQPTLPSTLNDFNDVNTAFHIPQNTNVLTWTANNTWEPQASFSGSYNDLTNKPTLFDSTWNSLTGTPTTISGYGITDAFDGDYDSLTNKPSLPDELNDFNDVNTAFHIPQTSNILTYTANNIWEPQVAPQGFDGDYNSLTNLPTLFDGDYDSLTNLPTLFDGDYNSLTNKPTIFDGNYNSLTNKPTIPSDLEDLGNVTTVGTLQFGQHLTWNDATGQWQNMTTPEYNNFNVNYHLNATDISNTFIISSGTVLSYNGSDYEWVSNGGGGSSTLGGLTDVNITLSGIVGGEVIQWDDVALQWKNDKLNYNDLLNTPTLVQDLSGLSSVSSTLSPSTNDILIYDGTEWIATPQTAGSIDISDSVPSNPDNGDLWWKSDEGKLKIYYGSQNVWVDAFPGSVLNLADLNDVDTVGVSPPQTNDVLVYTANNAWQPQIPDTIKDISVETPSGYSKPQLKLEKSDGSFTYIYRDGSLDDVFDVSISSPQENDVLGWTANNVWEPLAMGSGGGGGASFMADLGNVHLKDEYVSGSTLEWSAANTTWFASHPGPTGVIAGITTHYIPGERSANVTYRNTATWNTTLYEEFMFNEIGHPLEYHYNEIQTTANGHYSTDLSNAESSWVGYEKLHANNAWWIATSEGGAIQGMTAVSPLEDNDTRQIFNYVEYSGKEVNGHPIEQYEWAFVPEYQDSYMMPSSGEYDPNGMLGAQMSYHAHTSNNAVLDSSLYVNRENLLFIRWGEMGQYFELGEIPTEFDANNKYSVDHYINDFYHLAYSPSWSSEDVPEIHINFSHMGNLRNQSDAGNLHPPTDVRGILGSFWELELRGQPMGIGLDYVNASEGSGNSDASFWPRHPTGEEGDPQNITSWTNGSLPGWNGDGDPEVDESVRWIVGTKLYVRVVGLRSILKYKTSDGTFKQALEWIVENVGPSRGFQLTALSNWMSGYVTGNLSFNNSSGCKFSVRRIDPPNQYKMASNLIDVNALITSELRPNPAWPNLADSPSRMGNVLTYTANNTWEPQEAYSSTLTQVGDLETRGNASQFNAAGNIMRLPVGTDGQVLTANSSASAGIAWETPSGGGGGGGTPTQIVANNIHLTANTTSSRFDYNAHFIPTSNAQYDLGNAEYKVRHLFLSDNSIWIGDQHKMSIESGKVKTKKRRTDVLPTAITDHSNYVDESTVVSWINNEFQKTYSGISELSLTDLLSYYAHLEDLTDTITGTNDSYLTNLYNTGYTSHHRNVPEGTADYYGNEWSNPGTGFIRTLNDSSFHSHSTYPLGYMEIKYTNKEGASDTTNHLGTLLNSLNWPDGQKVTLFCPQTGWIFYGIYDTLGVISANDGLENEVSSADTVLRLFIGSKNRLAPDPGTLWSHGNGPLDYPQDLTNPDMHAPSSSWQFDGSMIPDGLLNGQRVRNFAYHYLEFYKGWNWEVSTLTKDWTDEQGIGGNPPIVYNNPRIIATVESLYPSESDTNNYTEDDYEEIFTPHQEGKHPAPGLVNQSTLIIDLRKSKNYVVKQEMGFDPGGDLVIDVVGAQLVPGTTMDFVIYIENSDYPKTISALNVDGIAATQLRVSGVTPAQYEMNTFSIKAMCNSSSQWLATVHIA
tara:strand:- start:633 stop:6731 length:6099 start_codon:yes stop_codon:yes gene_type:complete